MTAFVHLYFWSPFKYRSHKEGADDDQQEQGCKHDNQFLQGLFGLFLVLRIQFFVKIIRQDRLLWLRLV